MPGQRCWYCGVDVKILLLSAYNAASHQYWIDGLQKNLPDIEWTILSLPPRFFSWRIRGNSLTWAFCYRQILEQDYDWVLATSMVDLAALRGMVPSVAKQRTIVYFHENQFVYPPSPHSDCKHSARANGGVEPQLVNLYTALCADKIVFNSNYNRQTFFSGLEYLLRKLPDGVPPGICEQLQLNSQVIPVPLENELFSVQAQKTDSRFHIVWNHRWEYDKGPDRLYHCLQQLAPSLSLRVHVIGQQFRQQPQVFESIHALLKQNDWLGYWGFIEARTEYLNVLAQADAVLSTALHDFQGLSVLEAYTLGCVPLVPDRLAYREFIPARYRYQSFPEDEVRDGQSAAEKIEHWLGYEPPTKTPLDIPTEFSWYKLAGLYQALLEI